MVRWVVSFAVVLVLLAGLYYLVRLRGRPEDEIKERRRRAAEGTAPTRPPHGSEPHRRA